MPNTLGMYIPQTYYSIGNNLKILILLFICFNLFAQEDYSLKVAYGKATSSDFGEAIFLDWKSSSIDSTVLALDGGYLLKEGAFESPLDFYIKMGLSKFKDSSGYQTNKYGTFYYKDKDVYEATLYIKAYWNFDFLQNRVRVGFGEGVSYTDNILNVEKYEADSENDNNSKILNYLDFSVDFDFGKLIRYQPLYATYIGWTIKHRSGIYGLINDVKRGGSNYNTIYLERKF